jgi:RNA polymerase sigma-70 factor (ECF subfamily)
VEPKDDDALMSEVRDGHVESMAVLYDRHRTRLFNFFVRLTGHAHRSEDLVQEVFLRMLKYRHTFKSGNRFATWMHQVARNAHYDSWHKGRREAVTDVEELNDKAPLWAVETSPVWETQNNQEVALLQEALGSLSMEAREVLVLSRFQDLKYEEVAKVLGCTAGAVKMRVFRAMQELRDRFLNLAGKEDI